MGHIETQKRKDMSWIMTLGRKGGYNLQMKSRRLVETMRINGLGYGRT